MSIAQTVQSSEHAGFFAYMGVVAAIVFANLGSAYGTAKTGVGICSMGVLRPQLIFKSVIPVVMTGVLGIYGLIVGVQIKGQAEKGLTYHKAYQLLGAGLCCGLTALAAGITIGIVGDAGVRANAQQEKVFIGMILILIFAEAVGLYGFILSLMMITNDSK